MTVRVLVVATAVAVLAGCGGSGAGDRSEAGVRSAMKQWVQDLQDTKVGAVCDRMSERAKADLKKESSGFGGGDCKGLMLLARGFLGDKELDRMKEQIESAKVTVRGDTAVMAALASDDSPTRLVFNDGEWLIDGDLGAGGGGSADSGDSGEPSREAVRSWPTKWCQAEPGMARAELFALMGKPTEESRESASWSAFQYQFNAFFDVDDHVRQLDINTIDLSEAEKADLGCADTRR